MKKKIFFLSFLLILCFLRFEEPITQKVSPHNIEKYEMKDLKVDSLIKNDFVPANDKEGSGWELVFMDNFSGYKVELEKWGVLNRKKNYNNELQEYTAENVKVRDGRLHLTGLKEKDGYTSGLIQTKGKFDFLYGKVEVKANYPSGKGLFPAIWLLRSDEKDVLPEIDIFEAVGHEPEKAYFVQHWREDGKLKTVHGTKSINNPHEDHIFSVEWEKHEIRWFVDNQLVFKAENYDANVPMYLIVNLAIGGNWPGSPDAQTIFPADFSIDYIKIYEKEK
jgi:beta-glucanase (GH16 family)